MNYGRYSHRSCFSSFRGWLTNADVSLCEVTENDYDNYNQLVGCIKMVIIVPLNGHKLGII